MQTDRSTRALLANGAIDDLVASLSEYSVMVWQDQPPYYNGDIVAALACLSRHLKGAWPESCNH